MNPEDESDDETSPRPLEPVAAVSYAEARAHAAPLTLRVVSATLTALEKAFKHHPLSAKDYKEAEWNDVPDATEPLRQTVFNCVKRYRFIKYGERIIIEVVLMSGTTLRHIIKVSQVKGILTKGHTIAYAEGQRPEKEVIIDLRRPDTVGGYAPEQLKFKLSGDENALAFHLALMDAL